MDNNNYNNNLNNNNVNTNNKNKTTTTKNLGNAVEKHMNALGNKSSNTNSINTKLNNSSNNSLLNSNSNSGNNNLNEPEPESEPETELELNSEQEKENMKQVNLTGTAATANSVANSSLKNMKTNIMKTKKNNMNKSNNNLTLRNNLENEKNEVTEVESQLETNEKNNSSTEKRISLNRLCMNLLNHQIVMKLYHFQTQLFGAHKASDAYIEKYANTLDKFLEVAQGIYGKITLKKYSLSGSSHTDENIIKHINGMIIYWRTKINDVLDEYTDLINIRDELVADAEQLKYLLSFK